MDNGMGEADGSRGPGAGLDQSVLGFGVDCSFRDLAVQDRILYFRRHDD